MTGWAEQASPAEKQDLLTIFGKVNERGKFAVPIEGSGDMEYDSALIEGIDDGLWILIDVAHLGSARSGLCRVFKLTTRGKVISTMLRGQPEAVEHVK